MIRSGSKGSSVASVQKGLKAAGLNPGPIDAQTVELLWTVIER